MIRRSEAGKRKTPVAWDLGKIKIAAGQIFLFRFIKGRRLAAVLLMV